METTEIKIQKRKLKALLGDVVKSAQAVDLVYVSDTAPGISRKRKGKDFTYTLNGKQVKDKDQLQRIKKLVIPPAWEQVWICVNENGHLQVTGYDALHRKQYKYHPSWNALRNQSKFSNLLSFGENLPTIRKRLEKDMSLQGLPLLKVLATVVSLMQCTCIRIGNSMYEKLYGSFGLTTLKDQHVKINGSEMKFSFKGKKGVYHDIKLKSKKLARIVQQCRDIPGKELFQYYDDAGKRHAIDSGMVNSYIKEVSGATFTAKDFRTWAGSLSALEAFEKIGTADTVTGTKKNIVTALDMVAEQLGNTRTVCKKYYVHPIIIDHYTNHTLDKYLSKVKDIVACNLHAELSDSEKVLMKILETSPATVTL
ncbi:MAG: DNA topoisomerase IB [Sphingobacteriales bacterium]|nr:MAG: DNA topoisomerase IB [Sphingobacteriales bacterium]